MEIKIIKTTNPKNKPNEDSLEFGNIFTDHMFLMEYDEGKGWHSPVIKPYDNISLSPSAAVLHYGQEIFEGLKTFIAKDGKINLFRLDENAKRLNVSADRICIPNIDEEIFKTAVLKLIEVDKEWIPKKDGTSLYIRPFIIATEPFLGVKPSSSYLFMIIMSPVGSYYKGGLMPTKIFVEDEYKRSAIGGLGFAKVGGNYAASLKSQMKAQEFGYSQVLWLDAKEGKYVEEIGTSNAFFVIDGTVYTPPLLGTILPGITRKSVLTLLNDFGIKVKEKRFTIDEVFEAHKNGKLTEVFATGTATVISPVGKLKYKDKEIEINNGKIGELSQKLYDTITKIEEGEIEDKHNWITTL